MDEMQKNKCWRIGLTAFSVISACLLVYFLLFRYEDAAKFLSSVMSVLSPVIFGFVIAYILNPVMSFLENQGLKVWARRKKRPSVRAMKILRVSSVLVTILMMLLCIYALIALLLPELIRSIQSILNNVPVYASNIQKWYNGIVNEYALNDSSKEVMNHILTTAQQWVSEQFLPHFNGMLSRVTNSVLSGLIVLKNLILGIFVSAYVLISKESILARMKRLMYAFWNAATANAVLNNIRFVDEKFGGFIIGKILDSLIIGLICYVGLSIMGMPYTLLVSVVVGITNIIPFFGPFIGAIPSIILIGCVSPVQALYFAIFILALQQFDGNILGPKILGDSVGVSSFMVLVAILIGGGLFGFVGMIIGVPLCAILISLIQSTVLRRIAKKDLPGDIEAYHHIDRFDPIARQFVYERKSTEKASLYRKIQLKSENIADFDIPLKTNPWDWTLEDVERSRLRYNQDWLADSEYCRRRESALNDSPTAGDNKVSSVNDISNDSGTQPQHEESSSLNDAPKVSGSNDISNDSDTQPSSLNDALMEDLTDKSEQPAEANVAKD